MVEVVVGQVLGCRVGIGEIGRGWRRLISDKMSYRNHYMCSGEASSSKYTTSILFSLVQRFESKAGLLRHYLRDHNKKQVEIDNSSAGYVVFKVTVL